MTHVHRQEVLAANAPPTLREGATEPHPHRMLFVVLQSVVAVGAVAGAWQLVASGLLGVELVVQIPFVGTNPLQAVFGAVAVGLAAVAIRSRRLGWRRDRHG